MLQQQLNNNKNKKKEKAAKVIDKYENFPVYNYKPKIEENLRMFVFIATYS